MKKKLLCILLIIMSVCVFFSACDGCGGCGGCGGNPDDEPTNVKTQAALTLNWTKKDMTLGDSLLLVGAADGVKDNTEFTWTTSNAAVATVSESGEVVAMSVGEAVITAAKGEDKAECSVSVGIYGNVPALRLKLGVDGDLTVDMKNQLNLDCDVLFNHKTFDDATISYTVSDETAGTVENGKFTPLKIGSVTITVNATWRGLSSSDFATMKKDIIVNVNEYEEILLDGGAIIDVSLYTKAEFDGKAFTNVKVVDVKAYEGDEEKTSSCIGTVIEGDDVISYDDATRTITGKKFGKAKIKYTFTDKNGKEVSEVLPVSVERTITDYKELEYSTYDGTFSDGTKKLTTKDVFGYDTTISYVEQDGNESIAAENGKITGISLENPLEICSATLTVCDEYVAYVIPLKVCAKFIYDTDDLKIFDFSDLSKDNLRTLEGCFVLSNDIDASDDVHNKLTMYRYIGEVNPNNNCGLKGTFDGRGYSITLKTGAGLFNYVCKGSVIKNVELKNVTLVNTQYNGYTSPIGYIDLATVSNVKISFSEETYSNLLKDADAPQNPNAEKLNAKPWNEYSILGYSSKATYENVIVEYDYRKITEGTKATYKTFALLKYPIGGCALSNVYVLELNKKANTEYVLPLKYASTDDNSEDPYYCGKGTGKMNGYTNAEVEALIGIYTSYADIKAYFAGEGSENFDTFNSDYWNKEQGFPVWANSYSELNFATDLGTILFSGWDDNAEGYAKDADGDNRVLPKDLKVDGTVNGVYLFTDGMKPEDLTVNLFDSTSQKVNLSNASTEVLYKDVIISTTSGNYYKATLAVYTRILTSVTDLKMFDFSDLSKDNLRIAEGCFALGNDISYTDAIHNEHTPYFYIGAYPSNNCGFKGLFDGMGYSVTIKTGGGLFNYVCDGSVIKNVELKNITLVNTQYNDYTSPLGQLGTTSVTNKITVSNVKISFSDDTYSNFLSEADVAQNPSATTLNAKPWNIYSILGYQSKASYENVVVEYDYAKITEGAKATYKTFALFRYPQKGCTFANVYVLELNKADTEYVLPLVYASSGDYYVNSLKWPSDSDIKGAVNTQNSYEAMQTYFATDDGKAALAKFDNGYWDIKNGYPTWKNSIA